MIRSPAHPSCPPAPRPRPLMAAHRRFHGGPPPTAPARHEWSAIALYTAGRAVVEQAGTHALLPGDLLLIPAGTPHRLIEADEVELLGLGFCAPCAHADGLGPLVAPLDRVRAGAAPVRRVPAHRLPVVRTIFEELVRTAGAERGPSWGPQQRALLSLILVEIDDLGVVDQGLGGVAAEALRLIEQRCLRPLGLDELAQRVGCSPAHLTTAVRRATGHSAGWWIRAGRLAEARRLLLHSALPVEQIAAQVGYADATHFIRLFRAAEGQSPAAWRRSQREAPAAP
ncbi:MAG: helix-turn-helix domain-containing protein [Deltaproteobacteria bacterium]|nr:helix-turn-helix domain-containing protein [Deltaproteobacteria bacterium]